MMETHGVKYIGSKKDLLPNIGAIADKLGAMSAIDVFSGTTRVAQYLRQTGIRTTTSDLSWATTCYADTFVHNVDNSFSRMDMEMWIERLNHLEPVEGWISKNYTGELEQNAPRSDGRCFQLKNAMKADAARDWIESNKDLFEPWVYHSMVTSVIRALDAVDNTVGVQQAYLKEWCKRSYNDIQFKAPPLVTGPTSVHLEGDALKLDYKPHDIAYLDPPYSPHAYSTYYHIWDSIARWDKPETALKARRRVDRVAKHEDFDDSMSSPWNRPKAALGAFDELLGRLPVKHAIISYSDESLVARDDLIDMCKTHGHVEVHEIDYARNIMSQIGNATKNGDPEKGQRNKELLIVVSKWSN